MSESRLPASPQGAEESGTDERAVATETSAESTAIERIDRRGMLPRLHGVEIEGSNEELVLLLAEQFYPELIHLDQIENKQEKRNWTVLAVQILRGQEAAVRHAAETFSKVFQPGVNAQVADTLRKGAAEEREREERKAHLQELYAIVIGREEKLSGLQLRAVEQRLDQEKVREANGERLETILIRMMIIAFTLALLLIVAGAVVTQVNGQHSSLTGWAVLAGGSGGLGLFSAIALMLHRTRRTRMELDPLSGLLALAPSPPEEAPGEKST